MLNKNETYRQAEQIYGVICSGIKSRKVSTTRKRRPLALLINVESTITECVIAGDIKEELFQTTSNIKTPFRNKSSGEWFGTFLNRHPQLSFKKAEHLSKVRKTATNLEIWYDFYDKLQALLVEDEKKPNRIIHTAHKTTLYTFKVKTSVFEMNVHIK